jgi:hypothetical protein
MFARDIANGALCVRSSATASSSKVSVVSLAPDPQFDSALTSRHRSRSSITSNGSSWPSTSRSATGARRSRRSGSSSVSTSVDAPCVVRVHDAPVTASAMSTLRFLTRRLVRSSPSKPRLPAPPASSARSKKKLPGSRTTISGVAT